MSDNTNPEARPKLGSAGPLGLLVALVALVVALVALFQGTGLQVPADSGPTERTFALSSDLVEGSNRYHPATLIAFEGDDIVFSVTNRGAEVHGFTVQGLGIEDVIEVGEASEFRAQGVEAGVYRYFCQLHPGHMSGQLVVLER